MSWKKEITAKKASSYKYMTMVLLKKIPYKIKAPSFMLYVFCNTTFKSI